MQVSVEDINSVKKTLHIEIPEADVVRELDKAYNELKKRAKVKGDPRIFVIWEGRSFIFLKEERKKEFQASPHEIVRSADEAWSEFGGD